MRVLLGLDEFFRRFQMIAGLLERARQTEMRPAVEGQRRILSFAGSESVIRQERGGIRETSHVNVSAGERLDKGRAGASRSGRALQQLHASLVCSHLAKQVADLYVQVKVIGRARDGLLVLA